MSLRLSILTSLVAGVLGCGREPLRMAIAAPQEIQDALQLGHFKDLRAYLTVTTEGGGSPVGAGELPQQKELALETDGSFVSDPVTLADGMFYSATVSYVDKGYAEDVIVLDQKLQRFSVDAGNPQVAFNDQASRNDLGREYDNNHNGLSNLGEIVKGWDPVIGGRRVNGKWQLPGVPNSNPGNGLATRLAVLPNGKLLLVAGGIYAPTAPTLYIVDNALTAAPLEASGYFATINDALGQVVATRSCTAPAGSTCLVALNFTGGVLETPLFESSNVLNMLAVAENGTVWVEHGSTTGPVLTRIPADGGATHDFSIMGLGGMQGGDCLRGPSFDNHWIVGSTLFAVLTNDDNCGASLQDNGDVQMAAITLPPDSQTTALSLAGKFTLPKTWSQGGARVAIVADTGIGGVRLYAAANSKLTAWSFVVGAGITADWASKTMDPSNPTDCTAQLSQITTNAPLVDAAGDVLSFLACDLHAFPKLPTAQPQSPLWTLPLSHYSATGFGLTRRNPGDRLALAGGYPGDPGAWKAGPGGSNGYYWPAVGALAIDPTLATSATPQAGITGFYAQVPQDRDGQAVNEFKPHSDVVASSDTIYFVTFVSSALPPDLGLQCSDGPPCYFLVAAQNTALTP